MENHSLETTGIKSKREWERALELEYDTLPPWYWTGERDAYYRGYVNAMVCISRKRRNRLLKKISIYTLWAFLIAGGLYVVYYVFFVSVILFYFYSNGFGN